MKILVLAVCLAFSFPALSQNPDSLNVVLKIDSLLRSAFSLKAAGKMNESKAIIEEAMQMAESRFGKKSKSYSGGLANLAGWYSDVGKYDLAEKFYFECKQICEETGRVNDKDYATLLSNLGLMYYNQGKDYAKAERYLVEGKNLRETLFGTKHPDYHQSLINLANVYGNTERFKEAEAL